MKLTDIGHASIINVVNEQRTKETMWIRGSFSSWNILWNIIVAFFLLLFSN
jgi:hypothetical protein